MYDIAIIGLGSGGIEAANIAINNGLTVIAFEKAQIGGTCLNVGCIPTKAILHSANLYKNINNCNKAGLICENINYDWSKIIDREKNIVSKFIKSINLNFKNKITLINSEARIQKTEKGLAIISENECYYAKNIIIATGAKPIELNNLKFDHKFILNSDDMFNLPELPKSTTIIGSGAIGLEWATILSSFNIEVKLIEKANEIAPAFDIDIQKRIERMLKLNKIQYFKNDFIVNIENKTVTLNSNTVFDTDCILSAVGRKPVLPEINCELKINDDYSTNIDGIYVIGDAKKDIMLAHAASYGAKCALKKIIHNSKTKKKLIPTVVYVTPEVASIGIREQDIADKSKYRIKKVLLASIAKSWCDEALDGFVKVIIKDKLIKGAHIVSKNADLLISLFNILIEKEVPVEEISDMVFPHPSFAEIIPEIIKNG